MRKFKSIQVTDKITPRGSEIYFMAKRIDNFESEGSFPLATLRVVKYYCSSNRQIYYEPLRLVDDLYSAIEVTNALWSAKINPAYIPAISIDFECFKSIYETDNDGIVPMPGADDRSLGRHAVQVGGMNKGDGSIKFMNSWGEKWGDNGAGWLLRDYLNLYLKEIWFLMDAGVGFNDEKVQRIDETLPFEKFASLWVEANEKRTWDVELNGETLSIVWYSLINFSGQFVESFDLRSADGQCLGWAHLNYPNSSELMDKKCCISDLFIWPLFRRRGYGKLLEKHCVECAASRGAGILQMPFYEMDDLKGVDSPARLFAVKMGYACSEQIETLPFRSGLGEKKIL